jgi:L-ascorbate metabolism protein UlaG (beta-lactamase superfamily)
MGQRDAAELARSISPRIVIPMAYGTPAARSPAPPLKPLDSFISATPFAVTARDGDVLLISPGELPPSTEIQTLRLRL